MWWGLHTRLAAPVMEQPTRHQGSRQLGTGSVHDTMTRSPAERERIRAELAARDAEITAAWVAGESAEQIARRYRLSHNRISQIVHGRPALRAERDQQRHAQEDQKRRRALAWSTQHPGTPIGQGAAMLGLSEAELRQLLAERADLHSTPPPAPTPRFSDDQVHHALTAFLAEGGRRRRDYDQLSHARQWPSSSTIITRHGTWTAALASAGHHTTPQPDRSRTYTDDDLWRWLDAFAAATPPPWTARKLTTWLAEQPGAPSQGLIRRRLGRWAELKTELAHRCTPHQ